MISLRLDDITEVSEFWSKIFGRLFISINARIIIFYNNFRLLPSLTGTAMASKVKNQTIPIFPDMKPPSKFILFQLSDRIFSLPALSCVRLTKSVRKWGGGTLKNVNTYPKIPFFSLFKTLNKIIQI